MESQSGQDGDELDLKALEGRLADVMLAHCYAASVLLTVCLYCLGRRAFTRYRLGCVLIVRWNCAADLAWLANKAAFTLIDKHLSTSNPHVMAWVCKLFHMLENVTMSLQAWLMVLFALERAALCLSLRAGLKHFSQFRLKIGACVAAVLTMAAHLNHIWMFGVYGSWMPVPGGGGHNNSTQFILVHVCSVTPDFETIYHAAALLELLANVYGPILVCTGSLAVVVTQWLRHGSEKPSQLSQVGNGGSSRTTAAATRRNWQPSVDQLNQSVKLLQLSLSLICYPPLVATGLMKAYSVHSKVPLAKRLVPYLSYVVQPLKNLLSALAFSAFVGHHMAARRCSQLSRSRCQSVANGRRAVCDRAGGGGGGRGGCQCEQEDSIPLRPVS